MRMLMRAALVSVSMLATTAAIAADVAAAEEETTGLGEIVVTARKKSENLQDTPISISAFDSAEIKSARIERLADLAKFTPGLNFTPLFGAQNQLPIIRGAAQTFGQLNVGVFLDGVFLSGKAGVDLELNDLQRIEVVKGPQSALYGRNTFAGAINYVTARPTEELTGSAEGTAGENGLWKVQGSMSGQIAQGIRVRAGAFFRTFDGFYKSSIDGGQVDFAKNYGGILTVELQPTERLLVTLRGTYSKEDNGQPPSNVIAANNFPGAAFAGSTIQRNLLYTGTVPPIGRNGVTVDTLSVPGLPRGSYGDREEIYRGSAEIAYDFDGARLTSITAYANRDFDFTFDGDNVQCLRTGGCQTFGAPFAPNLPNGKSDFAFSSAFGHFRDFSQELRLQSTGTGKLQWLVGFFYYNNETLNTDRGFVPPTSFPITTYANQAQAYTYPITTTNTKAYSGFGSLNYQVTDKFGITAELRYEHEDVQFRQTPTNARPANDATVCAATAATRFTPGCAGSVAVFNLGNSFKFWTPRLILNYKANDDLLVYASYARGAKTGGFNSALNITDAQRAFFPEYSNNFEVGFKSDLADKRVRLNMAAFYTDWQDQQAACQNAPVPGVTSTNLTYVCNVAAARIFGLEADFAVKLNDWLSVTGNYAYTNARYRRFVDDNLQTVLQRAGLPAMNFNGKFLPYVPQHKAVVSPRVTVPIGEKSSFEFRGDVSLQSESYVRADNLQRFGAFSVVDLRATLRHGNTYFQVFANNVFDNDVPVAGVRFFDSTNFSIASPLITGANRRQIGASVGTRF